MISPEHFHSLVTLEAQGKGLNEGLMGLSASISGECVPEHIPREERCHHWGLRTSDSNSCDHLEPEH